MTRPKPTSDGSRPLLLNGLAAFWPEVYDELKGLAQQELDCERPGHTLQPTALVHEVYLRMRQQYTMVDADRPRFFANASRMIRRVLVDYARRRNASRRQADRAVPLQEDFPGEESAVLDLLSLHDALEHLARLAPRKAQLVELRYFGGLGIEECAEQIGISPRTAAEDWAFARAWLRRKLTVE